GEFEYDLGRKIKFSNSDGREVLELANQFIYETGKNIAPSTVAVTVESTPPGATVLREGQKIGVTPLTLDVEYAEVEEVWELMWEDQPAGIVRVDLSKDGRYRTPLAEEVVGKFDDDDNDDDDDDEARVGNRFDGATGGGRPLFEIKLGLDLTTRNLDVTVVDGNELTYGSSVYPVFRAALAFFPFVL